MSRRIQIYHAVTKSEGGNYEHTDIGVVVFGPAGKAELFHDVEVVLMACADVLNCGNGTSHYGWTVNGRKDQRDIRNAGTIIAGWDRDFGCSMRSDKEISRTLILDAGEFVSRGGVTWRVTTPTRTPEQVKHGGHNDLTPDETLRFIAETILRPCA